MLAWHNSYVLIFLNLRLGTASIGLLQSNTRKYIKRQPVCRAGSMTSRKESHLMSIQFNVVERGNPARPDMPKKHYPSIQSSGRVTLRQLAERASNMSTLSTTDIMAAVESFLIIIPEELANGRMEPSGPRRCEAARSLA
jgi:hypothetical protein